MNESPTNPWSDLDRPGTVGDISGRRVNPDSTWDFFWSINHQGDPQLTLLYLEASTAQLPKFEGFKVTSTPSSDGKHMLNFTLEDDSSVDVFHALCQDLVSATNSCDTERQAVKESIDRAWNWHRLLKGKRDPRLTENEQQGLMGEFHIISRALQTNHPHAVIESWKAPEENAKDFIHDSQAIEVKAKRSAHSPTVRISSAEQLDTHDFNSVILAIVNVAKDATRGMDLHTFAKQLVEHLNTETPSVAALLEQKLVQRGLWPEHDYAGELWSIISVDYYEITTSFPRIEASKLTHGIDGVTYSLDISAIRPFVIQENHALESVYEGGT